MAQQGTAISKCGGSISFSLPALCLAPGASMGVVGCLSIRDLVVNHFPHPRPFHSCPWDQRSSALEPCMGTAPVRETAAELHVRDGGRTSSVSCTLLLPLPARKSLGNNSSITKAHSKAQTGMEMVMPNFTWPEFHLCPHPLFKADSHPGNAWFKEAEFRLQQSG